MVLGERNYPAPEITIRTIRIEPETLNLASKGILTAFITLPKGYNVTDINIDTVNVKVHVLL